MKNINFIYIAGCILFTVYGQLILKWRIVQKDALPADILAKIHYLLNLLLDPYILSGFAAAFIASLFWMAAMTKFTLSFAYPFMSLAFVFVMLLSWGMLGEDLNATKIIGTLLIISGIVVLSQGYQHPSI